MTTNKKNGGPFQNENNVQGREIKQILNTREGVFGNTQKDIALRPAMKS